MNLTTSFRFHFLEISFSYSARSLLFLLFPFPIQIWIVYDLLSLSVIVFHHANIRLPLAFERLISFLIVTPEMHQVHHSLTLKESNHNFSSFLSFWDKLFNTYLKRDSDFRLGLEGETLHKSISAFLFSPFRTNAL